MRQGIFATAVGLAIATSAIAASATPSQISPFLQPVTPPPSPTPMTSSTPMSGSMRAVQPDSRAPAYADARS